MSRICDEIKSVQNLKSFWRSSQNYYFQLFNENLFILAFFTDKALNIVFSAKFL